MRFEARAALLAAALMPASYASADSPPPAIRVDAAWIRWLPAGVPAGGFARLTNLGDKPIALTSASSAAFAEVSIHRTIRRDGVMQMEPVKQIVIGPRSTLDFETAGYHFMLVGPVAAFDRATRVDMTLHFADGASVSASFQIRKPGAAP